SASDVGNGCKLREIIRGQYGCDIAVRFRSHGRVENAPLLRVLDQILEDSLRVALGKRTFSRAQRMFQILKRTPEHRQTEHANIVPQGAGAVGAKQARCLGMMPGSILPLENSN